MTKLYIRTPNTHCSVCAASIYRRPQNIRCGPVFCSRSCQNSTRKSAPSFCLVCEKEIQKKRRASPFKAKYCSRACSNKGRTGIKYHQGRPNDKAQVVSALKSQLMKTRGPCCEKCTFSEISILEVHHVVERSNGGSDDPSNLLLLCPNCHYTEHHGFMTYQDFIQIPEI